MGKKNLFDLFKEYETQTIKDDAGDEVSYAFRALDYTQHQSIIEQMDAARKEAKAKLDTQDTKDRLMEQIDEWKTDKIVDAIIDLERGTVEANADLAPGAEQPSEEERAKAEKAAVEKWEAQRREELQKLIGPELPDGPPDVLLRKMLIERQIRALILVQTNARFLEDAVVKMVVDPETKEPMFSADPKDANHIGRLMPQTRDLIVEAWQKFINKTNEKRMRAAAKDPRFLQSGDSANKGVATPGETTETPSDSQPASLPSSPSADG